MENILSVDSISEDIFQCGRCKLAFTSLTMFLDHKREPCALPSWPGLTSGLQCTGVGDEATYAPRLPNSVHASPYELPEPYDDTRLYAPLLTARVPVAADEPNRFACVHCPKTFKRAKSLSLHLKTHTRDRAFQCLVCGRCFVQNTHLQRHVSAHRVWPDGLGRTVPTTPCSPVPSTTYSCAYCDKLLPNYTKFRIHLKTHISEKLFKCIQIDCSELFRELNLLLQHVSESHPNPMYYCHFCVFSNSSLEELEIHQQNHSKSRDNSKVGNKYDCPLCDSSFKSLEKLTFHKATNYHIRKCARCDKSFASEKRLRSHMRTHEDVRPFHCQACGASFLLKKYLETHLLRHGERKHACTVCSLKFKRKDLLRRHLMTHATRKRWECPFREQLGCRLQFSRTDKLKLHLKSHAKRITFANSTPSTNTRNKQSTSTIEIVIIPVENALAPKCNNNIVNDINH